MSGCHQSIFLPINKLRHNVHNMQLTFFTIHVIDTDAPSYQRRSPVSILDSGAVEKKRIYYSAVEDRRGNLTPIVLSVDGLLQREASHFVKRLFADLASR